MEQEKSKQFGFRILFSFLAFFIVFSSVDAFFVYKALSTHTGVVSENAYEIGLNYNKIIAEAKKRKVDNYDSRNAEPFSLRTISK